MPLKPGSATSSTATSGCASAQKRTASRASPKLATTRISGCSSSSARRPSRTTAWSSTRTTLIGIAGGDLDDHPRAATGKLDFQPTAVRFSAFPHRGQPPAAALGTARAHGIGKTAPVVLNGQAQAARVFSDRDLDQLPAAVLGGVGQRFLDDAKQRKLYLAWQPLLASFDVRGHLHARAFAEKRCVPAYRRQQAEFRERGRAQVGHDVANRVNRVLD